MSKKYLFVFFCFFFLSEVSGNDCLMKCNNFAEVLEVLEKHYPEAQSAGNIKKFRKWYQSPTYRFVADTLYDYAKKYFAEKLPEELMCSRIRINSSSSFAKLYGDTPALRFMFILDEKTNWRFQHLINFTFEIDLKKGSISSETKPYNAFLPDCKNFPDSCNFKITTTKQAKDILIEKGIFKKRSHVLGVCSNVIPPFNFGIPVYVNDDCMLQDYFINMYTGEVSHSKIYQQYDCSTFAELVAASDVIIQGEIRTIPDHIDLGGEPRDFQKGVLFDGIKSMIEIEVQKIFKGEVTAPVIQAIKTGGDLGNYTTHLSHGGYQSGYPGLPFIFFLSKNKVGLIRDLPKWDSLTLFPLYKFAANPIPVYNHSTIKDFHLEIDKKLYQRLERLTGKEHQNIRHPITRNTDLINWFIENRMVFPNRANGIAFFTKISEIDDENHLPVNISIGHSNRHAYLKKWTLRIHFNPKAFQSNFFKNQKLQYNFFGTEESDTRRSSYTFRVPDNYNQKVTYESDSTLLIHFEKIENNERYFQIMPADQFQIPLVELNFPVASLEENLNLKVEVVGQPRSIILKTGEEENFDFVFHSKEVKESLRFYKKAIIEDFYPKSGSIGDTITITGDFLKNVDVSLYGKSLSNRHFYGKIPFGGIIEKTNHQIRFIIPESVVKRDDYKRYNGYYKPISHFIKVRRKDHFQSTSTQEKLKILE